MSGILFTLSKTKAIQQEEVVGLLNSMSFRGDTINCEIYENMALGVISNDSQAEIYENESCFVITDSCIVGKDDLQSKLATSAINDAELIGRSWQKWGVDLAEHIIGEFTFIIWDKMNKEAHCFRDHFGIRKLYFGSFQGQVIISNDLRPFVASSGFTKEYDQNTLFEYICCGGYSSVERTLYKNVSIMRKAHILKVGKEGEFTEKKYWQISQKPLIHHKNTEEFLEEFSELFTKSVVQRCVPNAGILLTGGMDSGAVAAVANSANFKLDAWTMCYKKLIQDEEIKYSQMTSQFLNFSHKIFFADEYEYSQNWQETELAKPIPSMQDLNLFWHDSYNEIQEKNKVVLTGYGGDPILMPSMTYFRKKLLNGSLFSYGRDLKKYFNLHGSFPGLGIRTAFRNIFQPKMKEEPWPNWVRKEAIQIYEKNNPPVKSKFIHSLRQEAMLNFLGDGWEMHFRLYNQSSTNFPIEYRHPFFDKRLIDFLLACDPVYFVDKMPLRRIMANKLPSEILTRPKTTIPPGAHHQINQLWIDSVKDLKIENGTILDYIDIKLYSKLLQRSNLKERLREISLSPLKFIMWSRYNEHQQKNIYPS